MMILRKMTDDVDLIKATRIISNAITLVNQLNLASSLAMSSNPLLLPLVFLSAINLGYSMGSTASDVLGTANSVSVGAEVY